MVNTFFRKDKRLIANALAEDPSIYEYDEHYEAIERQKNQAVIEQKMADKEKKVYINSLKQKLSIFL